MDELISGIEENEPEFFSQRLPSISQHNSCITDTDKHSNNSMPTFQEWFDEINDTSKGIAEANNDESEKNVLENNDFVKYLTKLTKTIVLWSGLSTPYFNTPNRASSANVESYFGILKQSCKIPCRVDEFVCAHIAMMDGMTKEASQDYIEFIDASGGLQNIVVSTELEYDTETELDSQLESNNDQFIDNQNDENMEINSTETQTTCIACSNGDLPGDAHKCIKCSKAVHILEGCSLPCGDAEGYGESRICSACDAKEKSTKVSSKQLNEQEKWSKKQKRQSKSYLNPVSNWILDKRVKDNPKIAMLSNASLSTTTYKLDNSGKKSAPRNTCASDAICQVFDLKTKFIALFLH